MILMRDQDYTPPPNSWPLYRLGGGRSTAVIKEAQPDPLSRLGLLIFSDMSLPVAAEIHRRPVFHGEHRNPIDLLAIRGAATPAPHARRLTGFMEYRPEFSESVRLRA